MIIMYNFNCVREREREISVAELDDGGGWVMALRVELKLRVVDFKMFL